MGRPTLSLTDTKLRKSGSHAEPLLDQDLSVEKSNRYKTSRPAFFGGLGAKPPIVIAAFALIVFGLLQLKVVVRDCSTS